MSNPYNPPDAELNQAEYHSTLGSLHAPQSLAAGQGVSWIKDGFELFKQDAGTWVLITIVGAVVLVLLNTIPVVNIFGSFLTYVFSAGLMLGAKAQYERQPLTLGHLFAGFQNSVGSLIALAAIAWAYTILACIVAFGGVIVKITEHNADILQHLLTGPGIFVSIAILMLLLVPLIMGVWFSPALIVIDKVPVFQAIKMSIQGCLKNVLPMTIHGLILGLLFLVGLIPFMLGLLVVVPILYTSIFVSYKEIFVD